MNAKTDKNFFDAFLFAVHPVVSIVFCQVLATGLVIAVTGMLATTMRVHPDVWWFVSGQTNMIGGWIGAAYYFSRIRSVQ